MSISARECSGRAANQPDPSIENWVNMIWPNYDVDGNGVLDMTEAWKFVRDNMSGQTNQANFNATWAMMDTDGSGGLCKQELARYIQTMR